MVQVSTACVSSLFMQCVANNIDRIVVRERSVFINAQGRRATFDFTSSWVSRVPVRRSHHGEGILR
jgi:hypothetical protein